VLVDGQAPAADPVRARTRVGMVFQNPRDQFVAATVGADVAFGPENLGLAREAIDRRVDDALAAVGLGDARDERVDELSGGEEARVAVAGALAMEPAHLVLDEPFAGLDWPARRSLLDHLDALAAEGTSVVVVTHDLRDLLARADRVVGLREGSVALEGTPSAVRADLETIDVRRPAC
jgi:biotin transport system ATP-binding protein